MGEGERRGALIPGRCADILALNIPGGLQRGEGGEEALGRILADFEGRYEEAVAGVWVGGAKAFDR